MTSSLVCFICKEQRTRNEYSRRQLGHGYRRKCKHCIAPDDLNSNRNHEQSIARNDIEFAWIECEDYPIPSASNRTRFTTNFFPQSANVFFSVYPAQMHWSGTACHEYDCVADKWTRILRDKSSQSRWNGHQHFDSYDHAASFAHDANNQSLFIAYFSSSPWLDKDIRLLQYNMTSDQPLMHQDFWNSSWNEHYLSNVKEIISCIVGDTLYMTQNYKFVSWNLKNDTITRFDHALQRLVDNKQNRALFHLKAKNEILLINGLDNVSFFDLKTHKWKQRKPKKSALIKDILSKYKSRGRNDTVIGYQYVMTNDCKNVILIVTEVVKITKRNRARRRFNYSKNAFYIFDIDNNIIRKSNVNGPSNVAYYKGVIMNDTNSSFKDELFLSGYFRVCVSNGNVTELPKDIIELLLIWYERKALHLIGDDNHHYKIGLNDVLSVAQQ